jgi:ssDNA-binding Zn-finger/Zn-ribbon topoisomerase 1
LPRRRRTKKSEEESTTLDVARCPKCESPMAARHSRQGPYFHCHCQRNRNHAPKEQKNSAAV